MEELWECYSLGCPPVELPGAKRPFAFCVDDEWKPETIWVIQQSTSTSAGTTLYSCFIFSIITKDMFKPSFLQLEKRFKNHCYIEESSYPYGREHRIRISPFCNEQGNKGPRSPSKDAQTLGKRLAGNLTMKESGWHYLKLLIRYCVLWCDVIGSIEHHMQNNELEYKQALHVH